MLSAVSSEKVMHLIIVFIFVHKFHLSDTQIERSNANKVKPIFDSRIITAELSQNIQNNVLYLRISK